MSRNLPWLLAAALLLPTLLPAATAEEYYQAALTLYKQKDYEQAFKYYEAAAQVDPKHWKAYQSMGHCRFRQDRKGEALYYYEKSLALNPDNTALKQIADSLIASGVTAPAPPAPPTATAAPSVNAPADLDRPRRGFGLRVGLNWVKPAGQDGIDVQSGSGYEGGAFYWMELRRRIFFQPEFLVSFQTHEWSATREVRIPYPGGTVSTADSWRATVDSLLVETPLLIRFLAASETPRIHFFAGAVPGVLLSRRQKGRMETVVSDVPDFGPILEAKTSASLDADLKPDSNVFTASATGGLQIEIARFLLDVRYARGLIPVDKEGDAVMSVLSATAGYSF